MNKDKITLLKSEADYDSALERVFEIFDAKMSTPEFDELELLGVLIKDYEDKHHSVELPDPIEAIKLKMQEKGLKSKDLTPLIGSKSHVSGILNGKKEITLKIARILHKKLNISPDVFFAV